MCACRLLRTHSHIQDRVQLVTSCTFTRCSGVGPDSTCSRTVSWYITSLSPNVLHEFCFSGTLNSEHNVCGCSTLVTNSHPDARQGSFVAGNVTVRAREGGRFPIGEFPQTFPATVSEFRATLSSEDRRQLRSRRAYYSSRRTGSLDTPDTHPCRGDAVLGSRLIRFYCCLAAPGQTKWLEEAGVIHRLY